MDEQSPDLLKAATRLAEVLGDDHLVVIGGLAAFLLGVERYTADVDVATDLSAESTHAKLTGAGLHAEIRRGTQDDPLPWVVVTEVDGIPVQVLPAPVIGADHGTPTLLEEYGIRLVSLEGFVRAKCYAGGHQDLLDVAILTLLHPEILPFAETEASRHGVDAQLALWRNDKRIVARYQK